MKLNLLLNKIQLIQSEYQELLTALLPKLKDIRAIEALDEINLFWLRHIKEVQLYLRMWFSGENSYVFTAATYMDYDDKEHLPFLLMGDKHILDDPLIKYARIQSNMPEGKNAEFLYKQIGITAEDNLKILENIHEEILILPLALLDQSNLSDPLYKIGEQVFVSLFVGINNLSDFFSKCESIDDIIQYSHEDVGKLVLFSEDDDMSMPFKERFKAALAESQYMIDESKPDSYNFFILVFGCIQQAIDVINSCSNYGCIPYIRYPVAFHYISLLLANMSENEYITTIRFKMSVAFVVYRHCNKTRLASVSFEDFLRKKQAYDFNAKLFHVLEEHNINEHNFWNHNIKKLVIDELEKFNNILSGTENMDSDSAVN